MVRLYIKYDESPEIILIQDDDGIDLPIPNAFHLEEIDPKSIDELRQALRIAYRGDWGSYSSDAGEFAKRLSKCLKSLKKTIPNTFSHEPVIECPGALVKALKLDNPVWNINTWIDYFPPE